MKTKVLSKTMQEAIKIQKQANKLIAELNQIDIDFLIDQLCNSMEFYDKDYFVSYFSEQTSFTPEQLSNIFNSFWQIDPITRMNYTPEQWNEFINLNL